MKSIKWICKNNKHVTVKWFHENPEVHAVCWRYLFANAVVSSIFGESMISHFLKVMDESLARSHFLKYAKRGTFLSVFKDISYEKFLWVAYQWKSISPDVSPGGLSNFDPRVIKAIDEIEKIDWDMRLHAILAKDLQTFEICNRPPGDLKCKVHISSFEDAHICKEFMEKGWKFTPNVETKTLIKENQFTLLRYLIQDMKLDLHSEFLGTDEMKRMLHTGDFTFVISGDL
jgi:hypothetical protein